MADAAEVREINDWITTQCTVGKRCALCGSAYREDEPVGVVTADLSFGCLLFTICWHCKTAGAACTGENQEGFVARFISKEAAEAITERMTVN